MDGVSIHPSPERSTPVDRAGGRRTAWRAVAGAITRGAPGSATSTSVHSQRPVGGGHQRPYGTVPVGLGGDGHLARFVTKGTTSSWNRATPSMPSGSLARLLSPSSNVDVAMGLRPDHGPRMLTVTVNLLLVVGCRARGDQQLANGSAARGTSSNQLSEVHFTDRKTHDLDVGAPGPGSLSADLPAAQATASWICFMRW